VDIEAFMQLLQPQDGKMAIEWMPKSTWRKASDVQLLWSP